MKTKAISTLRAEANRACRFLGHSIFWAETETADNRTTQLGSCRKCGKGVTLNTRPMPNEIEIGGEAVALNCNN